MSRAKLTGCPFGVTYFASHPLRSYFNDLRNMKESFRSDWAGFLLLQLFWNHLCLLPHKWAKSGENLLMPYVNNKGADQPAHAHPPSLISAFIFRCLDSKIPLLSISEISSLYLVSVAAAGRFESTLVTNSQWQVFSWRGSLIGCRQTV